jgi:hypothetical protein
MRKHARAAFERGDEAMGKLFAKRIEWGIELGAQRSQRPGDFDGGMSRLGWAERDQALDH